MLQMKTLTLNGVTYTITDANAMQIAVQAQESAEAVLQMAQAGQLNGKDGHTPEKGADYWTAEDQQGMVNDVLAALPVWNGGSY